MLCFRPDQISFGVRIRTTASLMASRLKKIGEIVGIAIENDNLRAMFAINGRTNATTFRGEKSSHGFRSFSTPR
jgi:hypothetical protein